MTSTGDEPDGWDPTRPLTEGTGGRPRDRAPETGPSPGEPDASTSGDGAGAARRRDVEGDGSADPADAIGADEGDDARPPVLRPHLERLAALATRASGLEDGVARYAAWAEETLRAGGKLVLCGNGGSAATAEHVAAEYLVRFERDRRPLPAVALSGSGPVVTAAGNDFSFPAVFERQLAALAGPDDLVVLHSTSGESENLVRAARAAREAGVRTVGLLAAGGGRLAEEVDLPLVAPTDEGARAQELHLAVEHAVVDRIESALAADGDEADRGEGGPDGDGQDG